jgi:hypothetical protein
MNDAINDWHQAGVVHLWRYNPEKRGLSGWHFKADDKGLSSTIALAELLAAATYPAKRTLSLTKPSERVINGPFSPIGNRKVISPISLQLSIDANQPEDFWQIDEEGERAKLHLGRLANAELLAGLRELKEQGIGDFAVGPARGDPPANIWFW